MANKKKEAKGYKKTQKIIDKIYQIVREENPSKNSIAKRVKVSSQTITNWLNEDECFKKGYEDAVNDFFKNISVDAKRSLKKLVTGFSYNEIKTVYVDNGMGDPLIKERVVTEKYVIPNIDAIKFVLRNLEPKMFE